MTITNQTVAGEPNADFSIMSQILLPDAGTVLVVTGSAAAPGKPWVAITGSPLVLPLIPGAGSTFWNIQIDAITGAASVQTSAVADPPPLLSSDGATPQIVIFRQTLVAAESADYAIDPSATPDA